MKIGIIGSGQVGGALTRRFRAVGREIAIAHGAGPAPLASLARETGAQAVSVVVEEVAHDKGVVVIALPIANVEDLPKKLLADAPANIVVVDISNYYPKQRDGRIGGIEAGLTESGWVEQQIPHHVVKAFNMIIAAHILSTGEPAGTPGRIAVAVAGDESHARTTVMHLIDRIGFDTADAGSIADSWRHQLGSPVYCQDYDVEGVRRLLREARQERAPEFRATLKSPGTHAVLHDESHTASMRSSSPSVWSAS